MAHIPYIILFILCSVASGYLINRVYMRFEKNRPSGKSPGCKDHFTMSEENYRSIFDNMQDVFYRTDLDGKLIMASPSIKRLLWSETPDEYLGMNIAENFYYNPSDRKVLLDILRKEGAVTDFETILRRKNGSLLNVSVSSHFYHDSQGNTAGVEGIVRDITERKQVEELFRGAFHENPCPMSITSLETGLILEINNAWLSTFEYKLENICGKTITEINVYSTLAERDKVVEVLTRTGRVSGLELFLVTSTGKEIIGLFFAELVKTGEKQIVLATMLDITELKKAEELFRVAFHENPCPMTITEAGTGRFLEVNKAWCDLLEYDWKDIEGKTADELLVYSNPEDPVKLMSFLINTEKIPGLEIDLVSKTGRKIKGMFFAELVKTGNKTVALATMLDITEQQRLRQESIQNALIFKTIFDASPYSIVINRVSDGKYLMVNPAFEKNTGYTAEEALGKTTGELTMKNEIEQVRLYLDELKTTGKIENAKVRAWTKNGEERFTTFSSRIIQYNEEPCILTMTIDISDTTRMQEQLNHSQKMDAIGQLAGGVAHDFNNMLGGIMGAAELLQLNQDIPEKRAWYVNMIKSTAERAGELTAKLLAFSRKSEIELRPVDIHRAIDDTLELLHHSIDRRIDIRRELNAQYHVINGDMSQLMNIFLNLGINAGHAMPDGGTLTFSTRISDLDRTWCRDHIS